MLKIAILTGSTRDARVNLQVAEFVQKLASQNTEATFEIVDIKDYSLPHFNETTPPLMANRQYENPVVQKWSDVIDQYDGFIFVTPEYNKTITGALKDAIDHLSPEWNHKAAAIVSYGSSNGVTASYALRQILNALKLAVVAPTVGFNLYTDFESFTTFNPKDTSLVPFTPMVNDLVAWAKGLKTIR